MPKVRHTEYHDLPETVDEIGEAVRRILALGGVEHLSLNDGERIYVERWGDPKDELDHEEELGVHLTLEDMLQRVVLTEYVPPDVDMSPKAQLFDMFMLVSASGDFFPTHVLCADSARLARWVGMEHILQKGYRLLHAQVHEVEMFPPDVIVVFGSARTGAPPAEVQVALKMTLGEPNGQTREAPGPVREERGGLGQHDPLPRGQGDTAQGSVPPVWFGGQ